jgi:Na+/proline symporter
LTAANNQDVVTTVRLASKRAGSSEGTSTMSDVLLAMMAYVLVQFAIGIIVSRHMSSESDYILAGRSLGTGLVTFSVFASFFGAEVIVASAGSVYEHGLAGGLVDPFGYGLALVVAGVVFAGPLWRRGLTTFADLFKHRYSHGVETLVVIMLLPGSLFWAAAQIRAFGQVLSANSTLEITTAITVAAVLVGAYSVVGGLMADSVTDVIQGIAVIVGLVILGAMVAGVSPAVDLGAVAASAGASSAIGTGESSDMGAAGRMAIRSAGFGTRIEELLIPVCGTVVSVELISRYLGSHTSKIAVTGTVLGGAIYLAVGLVPVYLGLVGPSLIPGLTEPEQIVPRLAETFLPSWLRIAFVGAIVSAILSTVHSALHGPASQIAHNLVLPRLPGLAPKTGLWVVRGSVMALCIVAYALSLTTERIRELVEIASAFGSAGVFVVALFALFTNIGGVPSAYGAMVTGMVVWLLARFGFGAPTPYTLALVSAFAVYVILALPFANKSIPGTKD